MKKTAQTYCRVLLIAITICCSKSLPAQQPATYYYKYFNSAHGLPSSEIISLAKDKEGFLWIGTAAGLSRYDGYTFSNYSRTRENELIGFVNVLVFDAQNRLWIGTDAGLFCRFNNEITKISAASSMPQGVNDILPEKDGTIWLATENGPAKIHVQDIDSSGNKKLVLSDHILPQWHRFDKTTGSNVIFIKKAADGTVYTSQASHLFRIGKTDAELIYSMPNSRDQITSIFPISQAKIYFNTVITEIHGIENGTHTNLPHRILYQPGVDDQLDGIWFQGTFGLYYFHPQTAVASRFINTIEMDVMWPSMMLKEDDFFWVASHHGLLKIKPSIFTSYNLTGARNDYYSFLQLKKGTLLLGGNRGNLLEKKDSSLHLFHKPLVPGAEVKWLYEDERGWLWAGTGYQGLVLVKDNTTQVFTAENGLHDNSFSNFLKTSNNRFFAIGDQGITEIMVDKNNSISFKRFYYQPNITKHAKFYSGIEAPDGSTWIGGEEGVFQLRNDSLHHFSINNKRVAAKYIIKDKEGTVWIATDGEGLLKCRFTAENKLELITQLTETDGLNTLHYITLLADKENNIWAGSSKGLTFIGGQGKYKDHILNFDETDGFIKPGYYSITLYQDSEATIWAGTTFGFISFKPDESFLSSTPPLVYITGIRQLKTNEWLKDSSGTLKFPYNNNSFNFQFTALDFANQESIRYYYKLEGLDTNWVIAGSQRSTSYENLPPGKYVFHVKALNSKGKWSKSDTTYAFTITLPFWKQWWFILSYTAILIVLTVFFVKRRIAAVKKREAEQTAHQKLKAAVYREQLEIEQIINHFATSMNSVNSIDELLWNVARNCISKLNFEDCVIYMKDENKDVLIQKAAWGPKTVEENRIINPIGIPYGKGIVGHVAASGKAEIVGDTTLDERYIVDDIRRFSEIAVPIISNGTVIGVIDSEHHDKNFYSNRHLEILTTIAALCADKINTIKAAQQTREKEMEVLRLSKDFATSQLTALRTQMNPHFIFNALNSIQHYILQGNVVDANKYLSKFSKLQRDILHCSSQQFISLEKELEILNAYLQLEQYRFGESFTYKISMTDDIEPVEINIPPMILQPFVENAIWHGLMPRQTGRLLTIHFDLYTDDILLATLRDNGIGRAASARLRETAGAPRAEHESKGMSMVQQRLQLLQQQYERPFEVAISDITGINGDVQGTQVSLKIFIGNKKHEQR